MISLVGSSCHIVMECSSLDTDHQRGYNNIIDVGEQDMGMQHQRMCCSKGRMMSSGLSSTSRKKRSFREMILEEILEETLERKKVRCKESILAACTYIILTGG